MTPDSTVDIRRPPPSLFRYQRFSEWLRSLLVDNKLYYPILRQLNDPCEFCYHVDISWDDDIVLHQITRLRAAESPTTVVEQANPGIPVRSIISEMRRTPVDELLQALKRGYLSQSEQQRREMLSAQLRIDAEAIGICCFSQNGLSGYMSYSYAAQHTGVCLEFSTELPPFAFAKPVLYQDEPPTLRLISKDPLGMELSRMFVKSLEWQQEQEWRVINHRVNDGPIASFVPHSLLSISLAPDFDFANLPQLMAWLGERDRTGNGVPKLYQLHRRQDSYALERRPLTWA